jgi:hypothetical protein
MTEPAEVMTLPAQPSPNAPREGPGAESATPVTSAGTAFGEDRWRRVVQDSPLATISGHPEDVTDVAGAMERRLLVKPFGPEALLAAVDEALASGRRTPSA